MGAHRLSVQLYTLRDHLGGDLDAVLRRLADDGFTSIEPYRFAEDEERLAALAGARGLTIPTAHARLIGEDQDAIFASAARLGIGTVIDPRVPDERWGSADDIRLIADDLNAAAVRGRRYGVGVGYHNHALEIATRFAGRTALEVLADHLAPDVHIELDTYWAAVAGGDPVELVRRFGDRLVAMHLKDGPATPDPLDQVAVGAGTLPIRDIVRAAPPGVLAVVELDDTRGDVFRALKDSADFLRREGRA